MNKPERYWLNAAVYLLLSDMFSGRDASTFNSIAVVACFLVAAGYFLAMVWAFFKGEYQ